MDKKTKKTVKIKGDFPKAGVASIYKTIEYLTIRVKIYASQLTTLRNRVDAHISEPSATIVIKEENGEFGGWTGVFYLEPKEKMDHLLAKVESHFEKHFRQNHERKEFLIMKTCDGKQTIHKRINT